MYIVKFYDHHSNQTGYRVFTTINAAKAECDHLTKAHKVEHPKYPLSLEEFLVFLKEFEQQERTISQLRNLLIDIKEAHNDRDDEKLCRILEV